MLSKRTIVAFATAIALTTGAAVVAAAAAGPDVNVTITGLALRGYDPVAYFTDGKPIPGDYRITARYNRQPTVSPHRNIRSFLRRIRSNTCRNMAASAPSAPQKASRSTAIRPSGKSSTTSSISTSLRPCTIAGAKTSPAMSSRPTTIGRASRTRRPSNLRRPPDHVPVRGAAEALFRKRAAPANENGRRVLSGSRPRGAPYSLATTASFLTWPFW